LLISATFTALHAQAAPFTKHPILEAFSMFEPGCMPRQADEVHSHPDPDRSARAERVRAIGETHGGRVEFRHICDNVGVEIPADVAPGLAMPRGRGG
jgi:hypothetical protein